MNRLADDEPSFKIPDFIVYKPLNTNSPVSKNLLFYFAINGLPILLCKMAYLFKLGNNCLRLALFNLLTCYNVHLTSKYVKIDY